VNPTNLGKLSGRKLENKCRFCQRNDQFEGWTKGENQLDSSWSGHG
jgi:hypothetical protein